MKKVAILVPTLDRIDFVLRMIKYYASINCPHPIFIGDASSESSKELVLKTAQNNVEIYYFHWKSLGDRKTLIKLAQEANKADVSEFCAFHGDDDFFVAESLSKCADFLRNNNEYASAQGRAFLFKLNQKGPYGDLKDIGIYWNKNELNGDTALDRLKCISLNYWVPIFSVSRTTDFIHNMSIGVDSVIDKDFGEYVNVFSIAMSGKSKFIDCLYLARQVHDQIHLSSSKFEWVTSENWHVSYTALLDSLSEVLSNHDNIKLTESRNEINQSIKRVIGLENKFSMRNFYLQSIQNILTKKNSYILWVYSIVK